VNANPTELFIDVCEGVHPTRKATTNPTHVMSNVKRIVSYKKLLTLSLLFVFSVPSGNIIRFNSKHFLRVLLDYVGGFQRYEGHKENDDDELQY
jgi:hypothetical protein